MRIFSKDFHTVSSLFSDDELNEIFHTISCTCWYLFNTQAALMGLQTVSSSHSNHHTIGTVYHVRCKITLFRNALKLQNSKITFDTGYIDSTIKSLQTQVSICKAIRKEGESFLQRTSLTVNLYRRTLVPSAAGGLSSGHHMVVSPVC